MGEEQRAIANMHEGTLETNGKLYKQMRQFGSYLKNCRPPCQKMQDKEVANALGSEYPTKIRQARAKKRTWIRRPIENQQWSNTHTKEYHVNFNQRLSLARDTNHVLKQITSNMTTGSQCSFEYLSTMRFVKKKRWILLRIIKLRLDHPSVEFHEMGYMKPLNERSAKMQHGWSHIATIKKTHEDTHDELKKTYRSKTSRDDGRSTTRRIEEVSTRIKERRYDENFTVNT